MVPTYLALCSPKFWPGTPGWSWISALTYQPSNFLRQRPLTAVIGISRRKASRAIHSAELYNSSCSSALWVRRPPCTNRASANNLPNGSAPDDSPTPLWSMNCGFILMLAPLTFLSVIYHILDDNLPRV